MCRDNCKPGSVVEPALTSQSDQNDRFGTQILSFVCQCIFLDTLPHKLAKSAITDCNHFVYELKGTSRPPLAIYLARGSPHGSSG